MKAQLRYDWIKDSDFQRANPCVAVIQQVVLEGKDTVLQFKIGDELRQMSIFGKNWNLLIAKLGDETDNWIGKQIRIMQFTEPGTDKKKKQLEV